MDNVAKTSLLTAAMRAVESNRSDSEGRLFVDPYAALSQAGEVAPHRWPFPTAPLHIPNIPRGYYVEARKV